MNRYFKIIFNVIILVVISLFAEPVLKKIEFNPAKPDLTQTEINRVNVLIQKNGTPEDFGWLGSPIRLFSEGQLQNWQKYRFKKWDGFDVITDEFALAASISDMLLFGRVRVNFYDFKTRTSKTLEKNILPFLKPKMSATSYRFFNSTADNVVFTQGGFEYSVKNQDTKVTAPYHYRNITLKSPDDDISVELRWKITPSSEGIGLVDALSSENGYFIYSFKLPNIFTEGTVKVGDKVYELNYENSGSRNEFVRGVFPYHTAYWNARAQGFYSDGKLFSLNFGSGTGSNLSIATEDSFTIDRFTYKLNTIEAQYNESNYNSTWTFDCVGRAFNFGECHVEFTPAQIQTHHFSLFVTKSELKTVFGSFSGWVSHRKGKKFRFENIKGYIDVFKAKW